MNNKLSKFLQNFRIILAIAWKDILDGWKNKVILTSVITSLFLVIFYHYMPDLTRGDVLPLMVIFDPFGFVNHEDTVGISDFNYRVERSESAFLHNLRDMETPVIGLVIEDDLNNLKPNSPLILQGYFPYWMKSAQITSIKTSAEMTLEKIWGSPIEINQDENFVYPIMDDYAYGKTFLATAGLLIQLAIMGLSMAPQLIVEEKESQTLQAVVVSPANLSHFLLGKTLAVLFYTFLTTAIGLFFLRSLIIHWGLTLAALLIGMLTIITPGILLGALLESKQQIHVWIWVMFIPVILPIFFSVVRILPDNVMNYIDWWPTVALSRLLRVGFTLNPPLNTYGSEAIYLLSFCLVFFGITMWTIRRQMVKGA
jgi:ABC-type transport system involved in cytochrome c biogenesis permease component